MFETFLVRHKFKAPPLPLVKCWGYIAFASAGIVEMFPYLQFWTKATEDGEGKFRSSTLITEEGFLATPSNPESAMVVAERLLGRAGASSPRNLLNVQNAIQTAALAYSESGLLSTPRHFEIYG